METARPIRVVAVCALGILLGACTGGTASTPVPTPGQAESRSGAVPSQTADPFAGLSYRMDLPAGWVTLGTPGYDPKLDATPDVAAWLQNLDLAGQNAFRAYEPLPGATGLRVAIRPLQHWNPSPLQEEGFVTGLPGVTGKPTSDVLATGDTWKAFGYRWTERMDWGDGTPSARDCVGYFVMIDNPVNVVFCYPAGTDRRAEVEAMVATFRVLGSPVFSLAPGETATPSPTPFDKLGSQPPMPTPHAAPAMEALLPDAIGGRPVTKVSDTGAGSGMTDSAPMLKAFGKHPADLEFATGAIEPTETSPAASLAVMRLHGVSGEQAMAFTIKEMPDAKVSRVSLGGHAVTLVEYGAWPVWMYATGDLVYSIGLAGEATAAAFFAPLP